MEVRFKAWLENEGKLVIGEGRRQLLELVDQTGSINQAASQMKMSYRAAWGKIRLAEKRLGFPLLQSQAGGASGGGSRLTPNGRALLDAFFEFEQALARSAQELFVKTFPREVLSQIQSD